MAIAKTELRFIQEQGQEGRLANIVEPAIEELGYRLVRVKLVEHEGLTLQIMAEKSDGTINITDCKKISKALAPLLDLSDELRSAYSLEVSSPGIDRPLVRLSELDKYHGCDVRIELVKTIDGRRKFKGILDGLEDSDNVDIQDKEVRIALPLDGYENDQITGLKISKIANIKLILSKHLFKSQNKIPKTKLEKKFKKKAKRK